MGLWLMFNGRWLMGNAPSGVTDLRIDVTECLATRDDLITVGTFSILILAKGMMNAVTRGGGG